MTTFLVPTNSVAASERICDYLDDRVNADDTIYAVNSQVGGDETKSGDIREGEEALQAIESRLGAVATVETHQFVRGNEPHEDVLAYADEIDPDEIVIAIRERSPAGKLLFGSVAQRVLLRSDRPIVSVPRET